MTGKLPVYDVPPKTERDVIYGSSRRFEQLIQTISIPYKGLSEQE